MKKFELSCIAGGNANWWSPLGTLWQFLKKLQSYYMTQFYSYVCTPEKWKKFCCTKTCTQMLMAVLFTITQKLETTQMSINWRMNKPNAIYLYNGILFSNKTKWNIDTCYNMNEPWKHYAKWKMPVTKDHILCDSI